MTGAVKKISLAVAVGPKGEIGLGNELLWHLPGDLKYFKNLTWGHPMVMGRRTFESIGRALPGRTSIVVSRDADFLNSIGNVENCAGAVSLEQALEKAVVFNASALEYPDEPFITGGGQIYRQALQAGIVDRIYLTRVEGNFEADTFFPMDMIKDWRTVWEERHLPDGKNPHAFTYMKLLPPEK